jgi:hypothetical protein
MLVCPGPIARDDAGQRYANEAGDIPAAAQAPGGGAKLKAINPDRLAEKILSAAAARKPDLIVPSKARLLFAISQLSATWGDWLLRRSMNK